jgi:hypothetical protein
LLEEFGVPQPMILYLQSQTPDDEGLTPEEATLLLEQSVAITQSNTAVVAGAIVGNLAQTSEVLASTTVGDLAERAGLNSDQ